MSDREASEWSEQVLAIARESQSDFTALRPSETGLSTTVYASERDDYPAVIIDSQPGMHFAPSPGSRAFKIGEPTEDAMVDRWLVMNRDVLRLYAGGEIDTRDFYQRMRPLRSA